MSKVKSRGNDIENVQVNDETVDLKRLANLGKNIQLSFGEVTVREPSLEELLVLISDFITLLDCLKNSKDNLIAVLGTPEFLNVVKKVAAALTDTDISKFEELPITDWLNLLVALKEVVDWEKLSELFTQLGLMDAIKTQIQSH